MALRPKIIVICGPTASGKTSLALELAGLFKGEIIGADSMQVYKHMDIGTAKPDRAERERIPHHLIDFIKPDEDYTAARFRADAAEKIKEITSRGNTPFIAGGTGLYIRALTEGLFEGPEADKNLRESLYSEAEEKGREYLYAKLKEVDPEGALNIHPNNIVRVVRALEVYTLSKKPFSEFAKEHGFTERPYNTLKIGVTKERDALYRDIEARCDRMIEEGLIEEVQGLLKAGYSPALKPMCGLGYKEVVSYLNGECSLGTAVKLLKKNTRNYAKRQITWFKKDKEIRWFYPEQKKDIIELVKGFLS